MFRKAVARGLENGRRDHIPGRDVHVFGDDALVNEVSDSTSGRHSQQADPPSAGGSKRVWRRLMNSSAKSPHGGPSNPVAPDDPLSIDQSGARGLIGYRSYVAGDGIAACVLRLGPQHLNRLGVLHGGLVAMLLDTAAGIAVRSFSRVKETPTVTVSMTVNYISAAKSDEVTATARITGGGRSLKFADAELRDQDGTLLATASGAYKLLEK